MDTHPDWCDPDADGAELESRLAADPAQADRVVRGLRLESLLRRELRPRPSTGLTTRRWRRRVRSVPSRWPLVAAAAAGLLLATVWWWQGATQVATPSRAAPTVAVVPPAVADPPNYRAWPDGSRVEWTTGTQMREPAAGDGTRLHLLAGSLTATVTPQAADAPFRLHTDEAQVTVLGTVFTLARADARTELTVAQGRVRCALADGTAVEATAGARAVALGDGSLVLVPPAEAVLWRLDTIASQAFEAVSDGIAGPVGGVVYSAQPPKRPDAPVFGVSAKASHLFPWDEQAELRFEYRIDGPAAWVGVWIQGPMKPGPVHDNHNYYVALPTPPAGRWRSAAIPLGAIPAHGTDTDRRPVPGAMVSWITVQAGWKPGAILRVANLRLERPVTPRTGM